MTFFLAVNAESIRPAGLDPKAAEVTFEEDEA